MPPAPPTVKAPALNTSAAVRGHGRRVVITVCSLISLAGIFTLDDYAGGNSKGGPLVSAPFWLPYLFVILRVRGKKLESGLALAIAMGCAMFPPAVWLISYARSWDANWKVQAGLALVTLAQPLLVVAAIRSWPRTPREKGYWQIVIANAAYAAIALLILSYFLWSSPSPAPRTLPIAVTSFNRYEPAGWVYN